MRTFSQADWSAAQAAWTAGRFSDEWKPFRHQAAMRGILYPPEGSRFDSWEDDEPSQRAMLVRAIRESPALLSECIEHAHSWAGVIARLVRVRDEWRAELHRREWIYAEERENPNDREATVVLKRILDRIAAS